MSRASATKIDRENATEETAILDDLVFFTPMVEIGHHFRSYALLWVTKLIMVGQKRGCVFVSVCSLIVHESVIEMWFDYMEQYVKWFTISAKILVCVFFHAVLDRYALLMWYKQLYTPSISHKRMSTHTHRTLSTQSIWTCFLIFYAIWYRCCIQIHFFCHHHRRKNIKNNLFNFKKYNTLSKEYIAYHIFNIVHHTNAYTCINVVVYFLFGLLAYFATQCLSAQIAIDFCAKWIVKNVRTNHLNLWKTRNDCDNDNANQNTMNCSVYRVRITHTCIKTNTIHYE